MTTGAQDPAEVDKSQFNLFNPTPRELQRNLSPERPDATQNPTTVDAGVVQLETAFFSYEYDSTRLTPDTVETWSVGQETNLRLGLLDDTERHVIFDLYTSQETRPDAGPTTTESGFSDVQLRLRHNFWGNAGIRGQYLGTALGADAFLVIPTGTSLSTDRVEGGADLNLAWEFSAGLALAFTLEPSFVYDNSRGRYDFEFLHTLELIVETFDAGAGYIEYAGTATTRGSSAYQAQLGAGVIFWVGCAYWI